MANLLRDVTRKLALPHPEWTVSSLSGGAQSPLVKAGILIPTGRRSLYECRACDADCPGVLEVFERHRPGVASLDLAAQCLRDGHRIEVAPADVTVWTLDAVRLADLVRAAFCCPDCAQTPSGRAFLLGQSALKLGRRQRQIVLLDCLSDENDPVLKRELPRETSFLLIVGALSCSPTEPSLRRRVFRLEDVLRCAPEGGLELDAEVIDDMLEEKAGAPVAKRPRANRRATEEKLAKYFLEIACSLLKAKGEQERRKIRHETLTVEVIGEKVGLSKSKVSENYLGRKVIRELEARGESEPPYLLFYRVCRAPDFFYVLRDYATSLDCSFSSKSVQSVYAGLLTHLAAHRSETASR